MRTRLLLSLMGDVGFIYKVSEAPLTYSVTTGRITSLNAESSVRAFVAGGVIRQLDFPPSSVYFLSARLRAEAGLSPVSLYYCRL